MLTRAFYGRVTKNELCQPSIRPNQPIKQQADASLLHPAKRTSKQNNNKTFKMTLVPTLTLVSLHIFQCVKHQVSYLLSVL